MGLGWSKVSGYKRVPEPPTVAKTWGNMVALSIERLSSLLLAAESIALHDLSYVTRP
jgi:hypothetical protein